MTNRESEFLPPPMLALTLNPLYVVAHGTTRTVERIRHDIRVKGSDNFPLKGPVLLGPSHREASDPETAGISVKRQIRFMQKEELETAEYLYLGLFLRLLGTFPVNRQNPQPSSLKKAISHLQKGRAVGIFPEGSRYANGKGKKVRGAEIGELFESIGGLAVNHDAALVAMGIGTAVRRQGGRIKDKVRRVVVAKPIYRQPGLSKKRAREVIMLQFRETLQEVFDEASEAATSEV